jgi:hypothetical protein
VERAQAPRGRPRPRATASLLVGAVTVSLVLPLGSTSPAPGKVEVPSLQLAYGPELRVAQAAEPSVLPVAPPTTDNSEGYPAFTSYPMADLTLARSPAEETGTSSGSSGPSDSHRSGSSAAGGDVGGADHRSGDDSHEPAGVSSAGKGDTSAASPSARGRITEPQPPPTASAPSTPVPGPPIAGSPAPKGHEPSDPSRAPTPTPATPPTSTPPSSPSTPAPTPPPQAPPAPTPTPSPSPTVPDPVELPPHTGVPIPAERLSTYLPLLLTAWEARGPRSTDLEQAAALGIWWALMEACAGTETSLSEAVACRAAAGEVIRHLQDPIPDPRGWSIVDERAREEGYRLGWGTLYPASLEAVPSVPAALPEWARDPRMEPS